MNRPATTLFLLTSVDGKISTGSGKEFDFDRDIPAIPCASDGLVQYYRLEKETSEWSLCTGKTQAKLGVNKAQTLPEKTNVNHVIIDSNHLNKNGIEYLANKANKLVVITNRACHDAHEVMLYMPNITVIPQGSCECLTPAFNKLYDLGCRELTVQSGGMLNKSLFKEGLIDYLDIVVAPIVVGGKHTPTMVDGEDHTSLSSLLKHGNLKLLECTALEHSYVRLRYKVRHQE